MKKQSVLQNILQGCFIATFLFMGFVGFTALSSPAKAETEYTFGAVPQFEPRKLAGIWIPILKELEERTGLKFKMIGSSEIPEFEVDFMGGKLDFAYMNPYHALIASTEQGYVPLVRDNGRRLFGVLTVKKDGPVNSIAELDGKEISFPAPNALGASLLMRADLDQIHKIKFRSRYVQTHSSVYLNVLLGDTAAGGGVMGTFNRQKPEIQDGLKIIYKTRTVAPHPVVAHPRVPKKHMDLVKKAFLDMGKTEEGAAMLAKIPMKKIGVAEIKEYLELGEWGLDKYFVEN